MVHVVETADAIRLGSSLVRDRQAEVELEQLTPWESACASGHQPCRGKELVEMGMADFVNPTSSSVHQEHTNGRVSLTA